VDILINRTNLQKCYIGWPQQPPREKVQKLKNDILDFTKNNGFQNIQHSDDSGVLSSDFPGLGISVASVTSTASTASVASMTSTASFHKINY
jgi:hypothetical protein